MKTQDLQKCLNHKAKALEKLLTSKDVLNYQNRNDYYMGQALYRIAVQQFREFIIRNFHSNVIGMKAIGKFSYFII